MNLVERFMRLYASTRAMPDVALLDLDLHWPEVEVLLNEEEWPFVRADLEVGHAQPGSAGFVAHVDGQCVGFFTAHTFGDVGYLDMMIVAAEHRHGTVAQALYVAGADALTGTVGTVVHSTNDSAPIIRLLGFKPGQTFTLLTRDGVEKQGGGSPITPSRAQLLDLDTQIFGLRREPWLDALLDQPDVHFAGVDGATACLRPRTDGAYCLDIACPDLDALPSLIDAVLAGHGSKPLQCFAKTDSALHRLLLEQGFSVPEFFVEIGPLIEWRRGDTHGYGTSAAVQSLMWL